MFLISRRFWTKRVEALWVARFVDHHLHLADKTAKAKNAGTFFTGQGPVLAHLAIHGCARQAKRKRLGATP